MDDIYLIEIWLGDGPSTLERTRTKRQMHPETLWLWAIGTSFVSLLLLVVGIAFAAGAVWTVSKVLPV